MKLRLGPARLMQAFAATCATLALCACNTAAHPVAVRADRLEAVAPATAKNRKPQQLSCPYRLTGVSDARPSGNRTGGLGRHRLELEDAAALVREQLLKTGLAAADAPALPGMREVEVQIKQLYLSNNNQVTKVPVVVYLVRAGAQAPFVIRAQTASMNWNSTENEALEALSAALSEANAQLLAALEKDCASAQG